MHSSVRARTTRRGRGAQVWSTAQRKIVPALSKDGFYKAKVPEQAFAKLRAFYERRPGLPRF